MSTIDGLISVTDKKEGDVLILAISGRLDAITSPSVEKTVFDFIHEGQAKLLFDLAGVDYLSSAGLRMLLSVTKKLKTLSGKLILYSVTVNVMDVLKMSGFDHVLEIAQSKEEGLRKF